MNVNLITSPARREVLNVEATINVLVDVCHNASRRSGWYTDPRTGKALKRNLGEMLCLIHSEVSEAADGYHLRANDEKLPCRRALEVELADAVIRICDYAGYRGFELGAALTDQLGEGRLAKGVARKPVIPVLPVTELDRMNLAGPINAASACCYNRDTGTAGTDRRFTRIHVQISKAMEGERKDTFDLELPHRKAAEARLAGALQQIFVLAREHNLDLGGAIVEKMAYNARRADHKPENRRKKGGKKW